MKAKYNDYVAFSNIESYFVRQGYVPADVSQRPVKQVDAYMLVDHKRWDAVRGKRGNIRSIKRALYNLSGFPVCKIMLNHSDCPDAEYQLKAWGFANIEVVRYDGGSIQKAVKFTDQYAKSHSFAYVICDCDMESKMIVKIIDPMTGNFKFGRCVMSRSGSRMSFRTFGEGPNRTNATPNTAYHLTLLAANIARLQGFHGFTLPLQHRPHDQHNMINGKLTLRSLTHAVCQGNFRGWFSDALHGYGDVLDKWYDTNQEDMFLTYLRSSYGKSAVMEFCYAAIEFHVDTTRQSSEPHRDGVRELAELFKTVELRTKPYKTKSLKDTKKGWCLRMLLKLVPPASEADDDVKDQRLCGRCQQPIPKARLNAKPDTQICVGCLEAAGDVRTYCGSNNYSGNPYTDGFQGDGIVITK